MSNSPAISKKNQVSEGELVEQYLNGCKELFGSSHVYTPLKLSGFIGTPSPKKEVKANYAEPQNQQSMYDSRLIPIISNDQSKKEKDIQYKIEEKDVNFFQDLSKIDAMDDTSHAEGIDADNTAYILRTAEKYLDGFKGDNDQSSLQMNNLGEGTLWDEEKDEDESQNCQSNLNNNYKNKSIQQIIEEYEKSLADINQQDLNELLESQANQHAKPNTIISNQSYSKQQNISQAVKANEKNIFSNSQSKEQSTTSFESQKEYWQKRVEELESKNSQMTQILLTFKQKISQVASIDQEITSSLQFLAQENKRMQQKLQEYEQKERSKSGKSIESHKNENKGLEIQNKEENLKKREQILLQKQTQIKEIEENLISKEDNLINKEENILKREENMKKREGFYSSQDNLLKKQIDIQKTKLESCLNQQNHIQEHKSLCISEYRYEDEAKENNKRLMRDNERLIKENECLMNENKQLLSENSHLQTKVKQITATNTIIKQEIEHHASENEEIKLNNHTLLESLRNMKSQLLREEEQKQKRQDLNEMSSLEVQNSLSLVKQQLQSYVKESKELNTISAEVLKAYAPEKLALKIETKIKQSRNVQEAFLTQINSTLVSMHDIITSFSSFE